MLILFIFVLLFIYLFYNNKEYFNDIKNKNKNKDILVVDFIGGIGNQLFFLATAFQYSLNFNKKIIIKNKDSIGSYGGSRNFLKHIYSNFTFRDINTDNLKIINEKNINNNINGDVLLSKNYYYQNYKYFINTRNLFIDKLNIVLNNQKINLL